MLLRSAFIILSCVFLLGGCEFVGTVLHSTVGDPPIDAQYVPKKVPTLVLVENYRSPDEMQLDGDQISHQVAEELKKEAKLEIVDADKLVPIREEDAAKFRQMKIQEIGKAVGAKQVIYVDLLESAVVGDVTQSVVHAHALAQVRVVDVETGVTLYDPSDTTHAMSMRTDMLTSLSSRIAKLFYRWSPENEEQETTGG
jgi:hypothetical protein